MKESSPSSALKRTVFSANSFYPLTFNGLLGFRTEATITNSLDIL